MQIKEVVDLSRSENGNAAEFGQVTKHGRWLNRLHRVILTHLPTNIQRCDWQSRFKVKPPTGA